MFNIIVIVLLVAIFVVSLFIYLDNRQAQKTQTEITNNQLEIMKQQGEIMKLQYEIGLKQSEIIENMAVNLEDKINKQRQELEWYTSNFESWKEVYTNYAAQLQSSWEKDRGGKK